MVLELAEGQFEDEVLKAEGLVLVELYADWCAPCKAMGVNLERMDESYKGSLKIVRLNSDRHMGIVQKYRAVSVPTLLFFKDGEVAGTSIGLISAGELKELISRYL